MNDAFSEQYPPKPKFSSPAPNPINTLISALLFLGMFLLLGMELRMILIVVLVLLFHEMGHFVAMRHFGYKNVSLFFVPFLGAFVSGEKEKVSSKQQVITVLAGPLPGIIVGAILLILEKWAGFYPVKGLPEVFLFLNILNLIPIIPLDGGKLFETLFTEGRASFEKAFLYISLILLVSIAWWQQSLAALFIGVFIVLRLRNAYRMDRLRNQLTRVGISYSKSWDDLGDEEFWKMEFQVRKMLGGASVPLESSAIWVKNLLLPPIESKLSVLSKIMIVLIWLCSLILPLLLYFYFHPTELPSSSSTLSV
ncbi:MAG: site-2 protease family protein [Sphingobacteriia bacterium]|nr:site-2 protease family protein [Sphingobacteriia bacterium]